MISRSGSARLSYTYHNVVFNPLNNRLGDRNLKEKSKHLGHREPTEVQQEIWDVPFQSEPHKVHNDILLHVLGISLERCLCRFTYDILGGFPSLFLEISLQFLRKVSVQILNILTNTGIFRKFFQRFLPENLQWISSEVSSEIPSDISLEEFPQNITWLIIFFQKIESSEFFQKFLWRFLYKNLPNIVSEICLGMP